MVDSFTEGGVCINGQAVALRVRITVMSTPAGGCSANFNARNRNGMTPLQHRLRHAAYDAVRAL